MPRRLTDYLDALVIAEPEELMTCAADCPMAAEGEGEPGCSRGPLVAGEVTGVQIAGPEGQALRMSKVGYLCTRGDRLQFFSEDQRPRNIEP